MLRSICCPPLRHPGDAIVVEEDTTMLEVRAIRANPDLREASPPARQTPLKADVDRWLDLDEQRRRVQADLDNRHCREEALKPRPH